MTTTDVGALAPVAFRFNSQDITVILRDGEPWFIASEILAALEMHRTAIRRLEDDEKGVHKTHTLGGDQEVTIISEPGLYRLIGRSNKPSAKQFNRWACHEVFPAIRKSGSYNAGPPPALPAPVAPAIDPEKEARFDKRAMELAMLAYAAYRDQIRDDHLIKQGTRTIEEWTPPNLARWIVGNADLLASLCENTAQNFRSSARKMEAMIGGKT